MGAVEDLARSETGDVGLRVFVGKRQAMASSSDRSDEALTQLAERAVAMAKLAPEDPFCGLAEPGQIARSFPALEICDETDLTAEQLIERARAIEDAARAVAGVTNSEEIGRASCRERVS
jgi:PmbA protein